jgi:hypothetical protein
MAPHKTDISKPIPDERPLSKTEYDLARWMLENGEPGGRAFLSQLDRAHVVSRCPCGCASVDFEVEDLSPPTGGLRILGDFVFGIDSDLAGAFVFERSGVLAGLEVYGLAGDAPKTLPSPSALRPFQAERGK